MSDTKNNNDTNRYIHVLSSNIDKINVASNNNNSIIAHLSSNSALNISCKLTKNWIWNKVQNNLSIVYYEATNKKDMKADKLMIKCSNELFSNSTSIKFTEQLI